MSQHWRKQPRDRVGRWSEVPGSPDADFNAGLRRRVLGGSSPDTPSAGRLADALDEGAGGPGEVLHKEVSYRGEAWTLKARPDGSLGFESETPDTGFGANKNRDVKSLAEAEKFITYHGLRMEAAVVAIDHFEKQKKRKKGK